MQDGQRPVSVSASSAIPATRGRTDPPGPAHPPPMLDYKTLEETVRTLLGVLQTLTGLDSAYLTRVDAEANTQETIFASYSRREKTHFEEGVVVPWRDTLCWRTIEDGVPYTTHVDERWGARPEVQRLHIRTYLSEPLRNSHGLLIGTLCALADRRVPITPDTLHVVAVFARLIAHHLECMDDLSRAHRRNDALEENLLTDPLTGVANRRGLMGELRRALAQAARGPAEARVPVAFIDLDRFKAVNDLYGHRLGDQFLVALAGRLTVATRAGESVARYGGDEFVVVGQPGPVTTTGAEAGAGGVGGSDGHGDADEAAAATAMAERLARATRGEYRLGETTIRYAGASVGAAVSVPGENAESLLGRADAAMYRVKERRAREAARALS